MKRNAPDRTPEQTAALARVHDALKVYKGNPSKAAWRKYAREMDAFAIVRDLEADAPTLAPEPTPPVTPSRKVRHVFDDPFHLTESQIDILHWAGEVKRLQEARGPDPWNAPRERIEAAYGEARGKLMAAVNRAANKLGRAERARFPLKMCAHCGGMFPPSRADAKTCSPTCRTALHRKRQRA
jgi:hypothetical protein